MQKLNTPQHQIKLRRGDGTWYEQTIEHFSGAVQDIGLVVLPGQTIYVEADVSGDQLANFHEVDHIEKPEKTIVATFGQDDGGGMILSLTQPFKTDFKFDLEILRVGEDHFATTSSLPVRSGIKGHEMWPYPISMVVLKNPRLMDGDADQTEAARQPKVGGILFEKIDSTGNLKWIWWTVVIVLAIGMIAKIVIKK